MVSKVQRATAPITSLRSLKCLCSYLMHHHIRKSVGCDHQHHHHRRHVDATTASVVTRYRDVRSLQLEASVRLLIEAKPLRGPMLLMLRT